MSFPSFAPEAEQKHQESKLPSLEEQELTLAKPSQVKCSACNDTRIWRGIDGFAFSCRECDYDMT